MLIAANCRTACQELTSFVLVNLPNMAKIISLYSTIGNEQLSYAAWNFAYAALWPDMQLSPTEIKNCLHYINLHLARPGSRKKHFTTFCECIMLAYREATQKGQRLPAPATWFHPNYPDGYAATQSMHDKVTGIRKTIPGYHAGIAVLARYYWNRIGISPTASFMNLRKRLLQLRETSLLSLCCTALTYQLFLHPNTEGHDRKAH